MYLSRGRDRLSQSSSFIAPPPQSGWNVYTQYCASIGSSPTQVSSYVSPGRLAFGFAMFLRDRGLKGNTISQYISHVQKTIDLQFAFCEDKTPFRSAHLATLIRIFKKEDAHLLSSRTQCKVAIIYPLYVKGLEIISQNMSWSMQQRAMVSAAWATGYIFSLRPSEYLCMSSLNNPDHGLTTSSTFFGWFINGRTVFFAASDLVSAPPSPPSAFYSYLPFTKGDQFGHSPAKAALVSDNITIHEPIHIVWKYFSSYFTSPFIPLFYSQLFSVTPSIINDIMKALGTAMGIDPKRLVPHSLRLGIINQAHKLSQPTLARVGNWKSKESYKPYQIKDDSLWRHASEVKNVATQQDAIPQPVIMRHFNTSI